MHSEERLFYTEELFYPRLERVRDVKQLNLAFQFALESTKELQTVSARDLEIACRRAAARHYRLCCFLDDGEHLEPHRHRKTHLASLQASRLPLNFRVVEDSDFSEEKLLRLLEYELNTEHARNTLLWRMTIVLTKDAVRVIVGISHTLSDGLGTVILAKAFTEELDWVIQHRPSTVQDWELQINPNSFPDYSSLPYRSGFVGLSYATGWFLAYVFFKVRNKLLGYYRIPKVVSPPRKDLKECPTNQWVQRTAELSIGIFPALCRGETIISLFNLSKAETDQFREKARINKTTVTAGLNLAAVEAALFSADEPEKSHLLAEKVFSVPLTCTSSVRGALAASEQHKVLSAAAAGIDEGLTYKSSALGGRIPERAFWKKAKRSMWRLRFMMSMATFGAGIILIFVRDFPYIMSFLYPTPERGFEIHVANVGTALQNLYEDLPVEKHPIHACGTMDGDWNTGINVTTITVGGKLYALASVSERLVSRQRLNRFTLEMKKSIVLRCDTKPDGEKQS